MCGISGIITKNKLSPESKAAVGRMSAAQIHRGPDGAGEFYAENVALASRRLAIIDPSGGWQPLFNEDKSLALVVNGEIYNYIELREQLEKRGHEFRTGSDCEVILHLYEENPADFVEHLRGMFAFALWDSNRKQLILARDRMGEKPLYLYETEGQILFASELKSLLRSRLVPFELDVRAVNLYFHYQYVPEPLTAVKNVRKLDAARMLTIDAENWRKEEKTYWKMTDAPPLDGNPSELIRQNLEEVSRLVVRSDVPVGVALSGGLDSSLVAALAAQNNPNLTAFSVGYAGRPESDERRDAEKFANFLKIPFHDVALETGEIVDFFPELNFWRDDPIADIAGFGYYAVMRSARENGVPVILQGQGGDELFWGYPQLREALLETRKKFALSQNPRSQTLIQSLNFVVPKNRSLGEISNWVRDFGGIRSARREVKKRLENPQRLVFSETSFNFAAAAENIYSFYSPNFACQINEHDAHSIFADADDQDSLETTLTSMICASYLRENGITQGDRLGMASSVEMRLPLVDHKFVETVIGLRKSNPDGDLPPKYWLRKAVEDVLPDWILNRPKRGFTPPVNEWYDAIFAAHGDSLRDGFLVSANILKPESGRQLAQGKFTEEPLKLISFNALVLEQWCRQMSNLTR